MTVAWSIPKKFFFSFVFIYLLFYIAPWTWLDFIPYMPEVTGLYHKVKDWMVQIANKHVFHVREVLVPLNGSGDTSWAWTDLWMMLSLSLIGASIWVLVEKGKTKYDELDFWLTLFVRYYVAIVALGYGLIKVFPLQMSFPAESSLATPLGDLLPMRFSWFFIGYSDSYQIFSGLMETLTGLLLLWRTTATLGALMATGVFANVVMLNLSYDIPVKLYSIHLFIMSVYLVMQERVRLIHFFFKNSIAEPSRIYEFDYSDKKWKYTRWILKGLIIVSSVILPVRDNYNNLKSRNQAASQTIIPNGHYELTDYIRNGVPVPFQFTDTVIWRDIIIDGKRGSVNSTDTVFAQRYHRGYFSFTVDSMENMFRMKKTQTDSIYFGIFKFQLPDSNSLELEGLYKSDTVKMKLTRMPRHFQLKEKQFHWLSEYNR